MKPLSLKVCIVGAGPAGLVVANALEQHGISYVILESRSQEYLRNRTRAGLIEPGVVRGLGELGVTDRLLSSAVFHEGFLLRLHDEEFRIEFAGVSGSPIYMYPQQRLVGDLIDLLPSSKIVFDVADVSIDRNESSGATVSFEYADGHRRDVLCDFIVGADGARGISREFLARKGIGSVSHDFGCDWLGILVDMPSPFAELVYAVSRRGFALHSMRGTSQSRIYLQVPRGSGASWTANQIWDELNFRLGLERSYWESSMISQQMTVQLRSFQLDQMRHQRLFVLGDAAHIVPPSAAKGLNLAVDDALHLTRGLLSWYLHRNEGDLEVFEEQALRRAWAGQEFSSSMTSLLHYMPDEGAFSSTLRDVRWRTILSRPHSLKEFSDNYTGLARHD
ncbi:4-hydroxybenzoate 3-monooxygenase [Rathayibacter toxicus]|uniref:FAD-binding domain-containing protein n=1 Tax=Rathayibacter toxicus TaxID=145458 RepID=A0A0C5BQR0_9MICO|nr:4-hydroxybenzoate 3-monooxygenase [Rathayibacter toxicus]AJM76982.1 hypothetical protein TI83_01365 [Rathayibacter toxicus]ALS57226.1 hypothetical protein APU90_05125 [Rathayibacter toxicus]KKM47247.1 hypothetical protein VT73_00700 [Rathayibacter toxicus]QOD08243.1 4-hydroxybenzoate 3-monooxygenase [Rathayibacter toxicus]QOD10343.1 4-hydroxybenzoate 3-monooxygenase [Rathayibacter toxicus]